MFSIRRNYYYYLYIQRRQSFCFILFYFNKKNYKKGLVSRKGKGKCTTFLFSFYQKTELSIVEDSRRFASLLFCILCETCFSFLFEIIQTEYIRDGEGGNGKTRLTTLVLIKGLGPFVSTSEVYVKHVIFYILFIIRLIPRG